MSLDGRLDAVRAFAARYEAEGELIAFSDLLTAVRRGSISRPGFIAAFGSPPSQEIGFGLLGPAALAMRARRVVLVNSAEATVASMSLSRYLAATAAASARAITSSAAALAIQRRLAKRLARGPAGPAERSGVELERMVYLRNPGGYSAAVGGSVTHTIEVIRALAAEGVSVDCLTTDPNIASAGSGQQGESPQWKVRPPRVAFNAVPASNALGGDLALVRAARSGARGCDAIYQRHARFSMAGALLSRLTGRPLLLEYNSPGGFQASDPASFAGQRALCEEAALHVAARIVVVSDVACDLLVSRGFEPGKILVNPNGVDVERFASARGEASRERLGIGPEDFLVGFTGSFLAFHGVPVLARAFALLAERRADARLLLVGDGEERSEVEGILAEAGCAERAILPGATRRERIPELLAACDVLASPHVGFADGTPFFGSPTKLFEYMAARKAIVASRLGQIEDVLEDGETALLTPPGDADALAEALDRLAGDPALRSRLGDAAHAQAVAGHTWRHNARRLRSAYADLPLRGSR